MSAPTLLQRITRLGLILMMGVSMSACSESWKEEVLLHDGSTIIVQRSQTYKGMHELGQPVPVGEHTISFTLPNSGQKFSWTSEYGEDIGRTNFNVLALHVLGNTPYLIVSPNLCLSYNKWGRPNPPYVIFKHDGKDWIRVQLVDLPVEFKDMNLTHAGKMVEIERAASQSGYVSAIDVKKINLYLSQPEFKAILREPLPEKQFLESCPKLVRTGDGWKSFDWFTSQHSLDACMKFCERESVTAQSCPCANQN